jgi:hypothetical protein
VLSPRLRADTLSDVDKQDRDDDLAFEVIHYAEELVGEDRYAGAWIDRSLQRPVLGMALVAPEAAQVTSIQDEARRAGWILAIDVVKYSRAQLISFYDGLEGPESGSVNAFGWDSRLNKVVVHLSAPDPAAVAYFRERIPDDALLIRYEPYGPAVAMQALPRAGPPAAGR